MIEHTLITPSYIDSLSFEELKHIALDQYKTLTDLRDKITVYKEHIRHLQIVLRDAHLSKMTINKPKEVEIKVTTTPTLFQLREWWSAMQLDDLSISFSDSFPSSLDEFRTDIAKGDKILFFCLVDNQTAGAMWLYSLQNDIKPMWVGVYILPAYRNGMVSKQIAEECIQQATEMGIQHIFAAVNINNEPSKRLTESVGFYYVTCALNFSRFNGILTDSYIYTLNKGDTKIALCLARSHSFYQYNTKGVIQWPSSK